MDANTYAKLYENYDNNYTKTEIIWILLDLLEELGEFEE